MCSRAHRVEPPAELRAQHERRIDRVVDRARAGIRLVLDRDREFSAQPRDERLRRGAPGERAQDASLTLEDRLGADVPVLRQPGGDDAVVGRGAGVDALLHREAVHFHQAAGVRARDAERARRLRRVEPAQARRRGGRAEHAGDRRRVEAPVAQRVVGRARDARHHVAAERRGEQEVAPAGADRFGRRERRREHRRTEMEEGLIVDVVELDAVRRHRVGERGRLRGQHRSRDRTPTPRVSADPYSA